MIRVENFDVVFVPVDLLGNSISIKKSDLLNRVKHGENFYCPCPKCKEEYSVKYCPPIMRPEHWYCEKCNTRYILKSDGKFEEWK